MKGTIRVRVNKDGSTSYVCQVKLGRDPGTGKERVLTGTARSERAAQKLLHTLVAKAEDRSKHASDAIVATVIEQWLATGVPAGEAIRQVYAGYIRLHILPALGDVPLRKLGVADLERWYAALRDKGLAPASIRKAHTIVRAALAQAVRWGWTPMNVAAMARPPLVPKAVVATPKPDSVRRMLSTAREHDPDMAVYLHLAAVTGEPPGGGLTTFLPSGPLRIPAQSFRRDPAPGSRTATEIGCSSTVMQGVLRYGKVGHDPRRRATSDADTAAIRLPRGPHPHRGGDPWASRTYRRRPHRRRRSDRRRDVRRRAP